MMLDYEMKQNADKVLHRSDSNLKPNNFDQKHVELMHQFVINEYGGIHGIRDNKLLESVVIAPYQSGFGQEFYPTIIDKAAKYLYDFSNYQVFIDGNKRTGMITCSTLLRLNGFYLDMNSQQQYCLTVDIANHKLTYEDVVKILQDNILFKTNNQNIDNINLDQFIDDYLKQYQENESLEIHDL